MKVKDFHCNHIIGKNIRIFRQAAGMTQKQLGEFFSLTAVQISLYERGMCMVGGDKLWKMAKILSHDMNDFFLDNTKWRKADE
jgi:transcriptional regulator with XRE-family HTH domain